MQMRLPPSAMTRPPASRDAYESPHTPSGQVTSPPDLSKRVFRFLDLPPELRNRVYSELLEAHGPLHISQRRLKKARRHGGRTIYYRLNKHKSDSSLTPKILRANRQVLAEAAPILYGNNIFKFKKYWACNEFFRQIGDSQDSNASLVRHVECYDALDGEHAKVPDLSGAFRLQTLVLTIPGRRTPEKDERLEECIKDLFEGMHRGQQIHIHFKDPNGVERNLVDMLRIIPESIGKRWWDHDIKEKHSPEMETPEGIFAKEFEDKMKEEITRGFVQRDSGYQGCLSPLS